MEQTIGPGHNSAAADQNLTAAERISASVTEALTEKHKSFLDRRDALVAAAGRCPEKIIDGLPDKNGTILSRSEWRDLLVNVLGMIDAMTAATGEPEKKRVEEKEVYLIGGRAVDHFFNQTIRSELVVARTKIATVVLDYDNEIAAAERKRLFEEEEARRVEAERLKREADRLAAQAETGKDLSAALVKEEEAIRADQVAQQASAATQVTVKTISKQKSSFGVSTQINTETAFRVADYGKIDMAKLMPFVMPADQDWFIKKYLADCKRRKTVPQIDGVEFFEQQKLGVRR